MSDTKLTTERIRRGLYRIVGIVCGGDKIYGPCGGELRIENRDGNGKPVSRERFFKWETFCTKCKACDCNGWPTLAEALAEAEGYFCPKAVQL